MTLFSAPNYCGEFDNAGAMMSVDETLLCSFQVRRSNRLYLSFVTELLFVDIETSREESEIPVWCDEYGRSASHSSAQAKEEGRQIIEEQPSCCRLLLPTFNSRLCTFSPLSGVLQSDDGDPLLFERTRFAIDEGRGAGVLRSRGGRRFSSERRGILVLAFFLPSFAWGRWVFGSFVLSVMWE